MHKSFYSILVQHKQYISWRVTLMTPTMKLKVEKKLVY